MLQMLSCRADIKVASGQQGLYALVKLTLVSGD